MQMSKPLIAVVGVTGQQGGAVARALAKNGKFAIRGITRNIEADKAKAIAVRQSVAEVLPKNEIQSSTPTPRFLRNILPFSYFGIYSFLMSGVYGFVSPIGGSGL
jgi:hypothetical protein